MKKLKPIILSGAEVYPLIEGGKGIAVSDGFSSGAWAHAGAVGTISGVIPDMLDKRGNVLPRLYKGKSRLERHQELIRSAIQGGIDQAKKAYEIADGRGRIHMNLMWEMGGSISILEGIMDSCDAFARSLKEKVSGRFQNIAELFSAKLQSALGGINDKVSNSKFIETCTPILEGMLSEAKKYIHGITCGAGMPYKLGEIASKHGIYYYPIVSSARAFRALWLRSFKNYAEYLGGVVYEDPWLAGGHNGLSNGEDPAVPEAPMERVVELRRKMNEFGLQNTPIILAGGIWNLSEFEDFIDNPDIGPVAFQLGTRPLLTQESPVAKTWQKSLMNLKAGDVLLQKFSPTGFYSSAVKNNFLNDLVERKQTQVPFKETPGGDFQVAFPLAGTRRVYISLDDRRRIDDFYKNGRTVAMRTPDDTFVFVSPQTEAKIKKTRAQCVGCLSQCMFSGWSQGTPTHTTGRLPDPRSFCISQTLYDVAHTPDVDNNLMFTGHNAYRFATDPMYENGNIPTVQELVDALLEGR